MKLDEALREQTSLVEADHYPHIAHCMKGCQFHQPETWVVKGFALLILSLD